MLATYVIVFTGAVGTSFSLTDKPWEKFGPGVTVLDPVNCTNERKNKTAGHKKDTWSLTIVRLFHAEGINQVRQHMIVSIQWHQQILNKMAYQSSLLVSVMSLSELNHFIGTSNPSQYCQPK